MTRRAAFLCAAVLPLLMTAGPALAEHEGEDTGAGISTAETVLLYVLLPLAIFTVIAALAWLPGVRNAFRYRPAKGWDAPPMWFAGPPDPQTAVEQAQVEEGTRGGARGEW